MPLQISAWRRLDLCSQEEKKFLIEKNHLHPVLRDTEKTRQTAKHYRDEESNPV